MSATTPTTPTALAARLRAEIRRRMPGYRWTVHTPGPGGLWIDATGTQVSGFNRLSTLRITWRPASDDRPDSYQVAVYGAGTDSPSEYVCTAPTLARSLRRAQDHCDAQARHWCAIAARLAKGRIAPAEETT